MKQQPFIYRWFASSLMILFIGVNTASAQNLSPSDAADSARQITAGKVLKVNAVSGEKVHYRVKVLSPEGRVITIIIDGDDGSIHPRPLSKRQHQHHKKSSHSFNGQAAD